MMKVVVLKEGVHTATDDVPAGYSRGVSPICSSVTLIKAEREGEKNILVDTGYTGYEDEILGKLKEEGLGPEDIELIINTHEHFDHCANNHLFPRAKKIVDILQWNTDQSIYVFKSFDSINIQDGVEIIATPGHKKPHCSVVIRTEDCIYVVAGDIITKNFIVFPYETEEKIESALKVLEIGDVIIPGHGPIIQKDDFQEVRKKIYKTTGGLG